MIKLDVNKEISSIINMAITAFPTLRFNQILHNLNVISSNGDTFNNEPEDVLERIKKTEMYKDMNKPSSFKGVF